MRLPNWNLTFTAKRKLQRAGLITAIVVMVLILISVWVMNKFSDEEGGIII